MILYWHPAGPMLKHERGTLVVTDLNPEVETQWRMSRLDMLALGFRCLLAAMERRK